MVHIPSKAARRICRFLLAAVFPGLPCLSGSAAAPFRSDTQAIRQAQTFLEPLIPIGPEPGAAENAALLKALVGYRGGQDFASLTDFLAAHPRSSWRAALLANLGTAYLNVGYYGRALHAFETAWNLGKRATGAEERAVADLAAGHLSELWARLGRREALRALFRELQGRPVRGSAEYQVEGARLGLAYMNEHPDLAYRCGPMAMGSVLAALKLGATNHPVVEACKSTHQGTSLERLATLAKDLGLDMVPARREPGSEVVVPSVLHWKVGHFAAIVERKGDAFRIQDPTFGEERWIKAAVIDEEASGHTLIAKAQLPSEGWRTLTSRQSVSVRGKGRYSPPPFPDPLDPPVDEAPECRGMARYSMARNHASLRVHDIPMGYQPPRGPRVDFQVTYNQVDASQPSTFTYSNLGPKWTHNWLSFVSANAGVLSVHERGGGLTRVRAGKAQIYNPTHGALVPLEGGAYERRYPDGSRDIFEPAGGPGAIAQLTQVIDPSGNAVRLTYDGSRRLTTITDALGQTSTLGYEHKSNPLLITQFTDPFGRSATFTYNREGRLASITDVAGIVSGFSYGPTDGNREAPADFINTLTTPYGHTRFSTTNAAYSRSLESVDPYGRRERMQLGSGIALAGEAKAPAGFMAFDLGSRNTLFWDKEAMERGPAEARTARIYHWLQRGDSTSPSSILESTKEPLEARVWYHYGQAGPTHQEGSGMDPLAVARVLEDGTELMTNYAYNALGKVTRQVDPAGRVTTYRYSDDGVDLLEVRNETPGSAPERLASYTYNAQHKPLTATDVSGQTTTFTYNPAGQVTTTRNPKGETTNLVYSSRGHLVEILAEGGVRRGFTYDPEGRVDTMTGPDGRSTGFEYDPLDRPTKVLYPDGTYEATTYDRLDPNGKRDRAGNWTLLTHNALRQLEKVQDAEGRITRFTWCGCGKLESLTDPAGHTTQWIRDLQGRVLAKVLPDRTQTGYAYDQAGRLKQRTDALGQFTHYSYWPDDSLRQVRYANTRKPTSTVSYTYEARYPRLATMTDGTGTTSYAYHPIGATPALGAGRLASVTDPTTRGTIAYRYDALGRVEERSIDGMAQTRSFDALGRLTRVVNPLGTFGYTYGEGGGPLAGVTYPNGQATRLTYQAPPEDPRLYAIRHLKADGSTVSDFRYGYDPKGQISAWAQQSDVATPKATTFAYDAVGQVLKAVLRDGGVSGPVLRDFDYGYDLAANRTSEGVDGKVTTAAYNDLNQLTSQRGASAPAPAPESKGGKPTPGTPAPVPDPATTGLR